MCTRLVIPLVPFHECYCYKKFGRFPTPVMAFNLLRVEVGKTPWMPYLALTFIDQYFSQMGTRNGDALTSLLTPDNETANQLTCWSTIIDSVLSDHMCLKAYCKHWKIPVERVGVQSILFCCVILEHVNRASDVFSRSHAQLWACNWG